MASLFVTEEDLRMEDVQRVEDQRMDEDHRMDVEDATEPLEDDDDPIVESIPIVMSQLEDRLRQSMHVFQYMERPLSRSLGDEHVQVAIKKESQYVEVRIPVDTSKFYDTERAEGWNGGQEGSGIDEQALQGVLDRTDGGVYMGQVINNQGNGSKKLMIVPIDSTVQLRHSFKYLDDLDASRTVQHRGDTEHKAVTNIQILQTSAKASSQAHGQDGSKKSTLGGSLRLVKKLREEEWAHLAWESSSKLQTTNLKQHLVSSNSEVLTPKTSKEEYLSSLVL